MVKPGLNIISKQALRDTIVSYTATLFAVVASLWIYPLELDVYGMAQILISTALLVIPVATLGTQATIVRFFPQYDEIGTAKTFLFNVLVLCGGLFVLALAIGWFVNRPILLLLESLQFDVHMILDFKFIIIGFAIVMLYNQTLTLHISNYNRIAIPALYNNLIPKIALPLLVLAFHFEQISLKLFTQLWLSAFILSMLGLTFYASRIGALGLKPRFIFFTKERLREIMEYSFFVGLSNVAAVLISRIDIIMVGTLIGAKEAGVYGIALFVANVLHIPTSSIWKIASPVVAKAFEDGDMKRVESVYKKSSRNLVILGAFVYLAIYGTLDSVIYFSSDYDKLQPIVYLFVILGIGKLVDMTTSVNHQILAYSEKYKYLLVFVVLLAISNVWLTYYFVMKIGITGAAWATIISVSLYNLIKSLLIYRWFNIHPMSKEWYKILALIAVAFFYTWLMPALSSHILNIIVFSIGLFVVYTAMIKVLDIQAEIVNTTTSRLRMFFRGKS